MTQKEQVLKHLKKHNRITSWDAIQLYGITRISEYIRELRREGYKIITERKDFIDRLGNKRNYGLYRMEE